MEREKYVIMRFTFHTLHSKWLGSLKPRRIRRKGHVARIGELNNLYKNLIETPQRKETLWRYGRMIILKLVLDKYGGKIQVYNLKLTRLK